MHRRTAAVASRKAVQMAEQWTVEATQRFIAGKVAELQAHLEEQEALVAQVRAEKDVLLQGLQTNGS